MTDRNRAQLHDALWAGQAALAALFFLSGLAKATLSAAVLQGQLGLCPEAPAAVLRVVGLVELAGALGLVLPAATRILPRLTAAAAACLAGVALLGAVLPATGGAAALPLPGLLLAAAGAAIAWGRLGPAPIAPWSLGEDTLLDRKLAASFHALERAAPSGPRRRQGVA